MVKTHPHIDLDSFGLFANVRLADEAAVFTIHLPPPPRDARWDPSTLPDDDDDDEPQWTPLQIAAHHGDLAQIHRILSVLSSDEDKAKVVNAPPVGWYGQTALQAACMHEHIEVVQALLNAGADIAAPGGNNLCELVGSAGGVFFTRH